MLYTRTDPQIDEEIAIEERTIRYRSLLFHGLRLLLASLPALLWAFVFNLFYAFITTLRTSNAIGHITDNSLAAQSLHHGFDLGTVSFLGLKLSENSSLSSSFGTSTLLFLTTYFLLVPGTLLCYQTGIPARLSTLLQAGILHFWRFVRILILYVIVMAIVLGPLGVIYSKYSDYIDLHFVERSAFLLEMAGILVLALVAAVIRLYFDLVEVYTVQVGLRIRSNGRPDRRVRKAILPALRALGHNFLRAYETFILLSILGLAAIAGTSYVAVHTLAQPRSWPLFALTQAGLFLMLLTRFWQRGAETTLSLNFPVFNEEADPEIHARTNFMPSVAPIATDYDPPAPPADLIPTPQHIEPPLGEFGPVVVDPQPSFPDPPADLYRTKPPVDQADL
ncbi:MAG: hypothetical protein ABI197_01880 [Granulicella sp.]